MFDAPSQRPTVNERREGSLAELWRREPGWRLGVALLLLQNIRTGAVAAQHRGCMLVGTGRQPSLGDLHGSAILAGQLAGHRVTLPQNGTLGGLLL